MNMKYAFLILGGALTFAACDNTGSEAVNESTETVGDVGADIEAGVEEMEMEVEGEMAEMTSFNETNDAIAGAGGDLTALAPATALSVIDSWIAKLDGMDGTGEITENLAELKEELSEDDINGMEVGTLLNALAEDTKEIAGDNMAANTLANSLAAAGQKLGGI